MKTCAHASEITQGMIFFFFVVMWSVEGLFKTALLMLGYSKHTGLYRV
jgi:hypothetical protein